MNEKQKHSELQGIEITDVGLDKIQVEQNLKKVDNYVILGDIEVSDDERDYLSIHYKCSLGKKMTDDDVEIEVAKLGVKNRYEKMGQGDEVEEMSDDEIVKALKKLDEERNREREERKVFRNGDLNLDGVRPTETEYQSESSS